MTRQEMAQRAADRALYDGVTVQQVGPGQWVAPSASKPDMAYLLTLDGFGRPTCTCPGYQYRQVCKHSAALRASLGTRAA